MRKRKPDPMSAEIVVAAGPVRVPAEIVPSNLAQFRGAVGRLVEQKVAEALKGGDSIFQPWFQTKTITDEIRKHQTVTEKDKWSYYFEKWGCVLCRTKKRAHYGLGLCYRCRCRTYSRLAAILREVEKAKGGKGGDIGFMDSVRLARQALEPPIEVLAKNRKGEK
jgi:hypothetical protein